MPLFEDRGPIRSLISRYQPLLPRRKFFEQEEDDIEMQLPPGITEDQLVDAISRTSWAQDAARGVVAGLQAGGVNLTPEQQQAAINAWARKLAQGMVRSIETGQPSRTARRRRRR